ncbi:MAG: cupin domain-containing protein [Bacteroidia bacterium]
MSQPEAYNQHMNIRYEHLEVIDVPAIVNDCTDQWFNQTLSKVNDSVTRLGIVEGEYHWHKHEEEDEFFFVLEGRLFIDLEDRTIELGPMQGTTITKGVMHRPRAPHKTVMLMVENSSIDPLGTSPK